MTHAHSQESFCYPRHPFLPAALEVRAVLTMSTPLPIASVDEPTCACEFAQPLGRRNVSLWTLDGANPAAVPQSVMTIFGLGGGYSSIDTTFGKVRVLYEAGPPHVYDYSIQLARIDNITSGST